MSRQFPHYFKPVPPGVTHIDVYQVLAMFEVKDQAVGHAVKKLLCAGQRGSKDYIRDLLEAVVSINRAIEIAKPAPTEQTGAVLAIGNPPFQPFQVHANRVIQFPTHIDPLGQVQWVDDVPIFNWDGAIGCPVEKETAVRVRLEGEDVDRLGLAGTFCWTSGYGIRYVVRYNKLRKVGDAREA